MTISTASFSERLNRIERERARFKGQLTLHVGDQELHVQTLEQIGARADVQVPARPAFLSLRVMAAVLLGLLAVPLSVAIRARVFALPGEKAQALSDPQMILGIGAALLVSVVLAQILRLRATPLIAAQGLGVVAGVGTLHNLAFAAPALAAQVISPDWVAAQQAWTEPGTLILHGTVFAF